MRLILYGLLIWYSVKRRWFYYKYNLEKKKTNGCTNFFYTTEINSVNLKHVHVICGPSCGTTSLCNTSTCSNEWGRAHTEKGCTLRRQVKGFFGQ